MNFELSTNMAVLLAVVLVWDLAWKGAALWRAGRNNDPVWFVFLLIINSAGILPIIYLLMHSKVTSDGNEGR